MAFYRFSTKVYSRSSHAAAVQKAAYRAAEKLYDERYGEDRDFRAKKGVLDKGILKPASAPAWMGDRERLWNEVERKEKREDSQLAREIQVALPHELSASARVELLRGFLNQELVSQGMVVDYAIHAPSSKGDQRHFHAHILCTMRHIEGDGFGNKAREWNDYIDHNVLQNQRVAWEKHVNAALERAGLSIRVDHRSLDDQRQEALEQGNEVKAFVLNRQPQKKRRHAFYHMENARREHWKKIVERLEKSEKQSPFLSSEELKQIKESTGRVATVEDELHGVRLLHKALTQGESTAHEVVKEFDSIFQEHLKRFREAEKPEFEKHKKASQVTITKKRKELEQLEKERPPVEKPGLFNLNAKKIEKQKADLEKWSTKVYERRESLRKYQETHDFRYALTTFESETRRDLVNRPEIQSFRQQWEEAKAIVADYQSEREDLRRRERGQTRSSGALER